MKRWFRFVTCTLLITSAISVAASSGLQENTECAEIKSGQGPCAPPPAVASERVGKELERQTGELLRKAERAEAKAAWHEQYARIWAEIAENQNALGDLASAKEPMAEFFADMHVNQKEKRLLEARSLRQAAQSLQTRKSRSLRAETNGGSVSPRHR